MKTLDRLMKNIFYDFYLMMIIFNIIKYKKDVTV